MCGLVQGEALRQSLLTRYYGKQHPRQRKDGVVQNQAAQHGGGGHASSGPGSRLLSRAEMTLHEVQVGTEDK